MKLTCFICLRTWGSIYGIIKHLRCYHHLRHGPNLNLKCTFQNCSLIFRTYSGFRRHLRIHEDPVDVKQKNINKPETPTTRMGENCEEQINNETVNIINNNVEQINDVAETNDGIFINDNRPEFNEDDDIEYITTTTFRQI